MVEFAEQNTNLKFDGKILLYIIQFQKSAY